MYRTIGTLPYSCHYSHTHTFVSSGFPLVAQLLVSFALAHGVTQSKYSILVCVPLALAYVNYLCFDDCELTRSHCYYYCCLLLCVFVQFRFDRCRSKSTHHTSHTFIRFVLTFVSFAPFETTTTTILTSSKHSEKERVRVETIVVRVSFSFGKIFYSRNP